MVVRFIDLFAGIGGIRLGFENAGATCVWSNDNDKGCAVTYKANFRTADFTPLDIKTIPSSKIPDFDVLCAGFPCQPFSVAGVTKYNALGWKHGFEHETKGTLFHEIVRILKDRQPKAYFLENVKHLVHHDKGRTFAVIRSSIESLGYSFNYKVVNAKAILPQNRERTFMVGFRDGGGFEFPELPQDYPPVSSILESKVDEKYTLTDHLWKYLQDYATKHRAKGNGFGYGLVNPNSHTRTLSARYYKDGAEILIPQEGKNPRRLTPRECARLQGYPDGFRIVVSDTQAYKQFGNSVPVPVIGIIAKKLVKTLEERQVLAVQDVPRQ